MDNSGFPDNFTHYTAGSLAMWNDVQTDPSVPDVFTPHTPGLFTAPTDYSEQLPPVTRKDFSPVFDVNNNFKVKHVEDDYPTCASKPPTRSDWETFRPMIERLYLDERKTMGEVTAILRTRGFHATRKTFNSYRSEWRMFKNVKRAEVETMETLQQQRLRQHKRSLFILHGHVIEPEKLERSKKRMGLHRRNTSDRPQTSCTGIVCVSPIFATIDPPDQLKWSEKLFRMANSTLNPFLDPHAGFVNLFGQNMQAGLEAAIIHPTTKRCWTYWSRALLALEEHVASENIFSWIHVFSVCLDLVRVGHPSLADLAFKQMRRLLNQAKNWTQRASLDLAIHLCDSPLSDLDKTWRTFFNVCLDILDVGFRSCTETESARSRGRMFVHFFPGAAVCHFSERKDSELPHWQITRMPSSSMETYMVYDKDEIFKRVLAQA